MKHNFKRRVSPYPTIRENENPLSEQMKNTGRNES